MKETTDSYAWIVVALMVLGIIVLLAIPFAETIKESVGANVEEVAITAEVILENIKVDSSFETNKDYTYYTQENLNVLGNRAVSIGRDDPIFIVGIYSDDLSEVIISRNTNSSNGAMKAKAFINNVSLTSAVLKKGVLNVGESAFDGCSNLTDVYLPDGLVHIGHNAFYGTAIESITIPDTVKTIEVGAFSGCMKLKEINFLGKSRPSGFYEDDYPGVTVNYKK